MKRILAPTFVLAVSLAGIAGCADQGTGSSAGSTADPTAEATAEAGPRTSDAPKNVLPLDFSRSGGFTGGEDRLHIDADGTLTVTREGVTGKPVTLDPNVLAELKRVLAEPKTAATGGGICADGYQYRVITPSWAYLTDDCSRAGSELDHTLDLLVPLLKGAAAPGPS
jgi:hypothetical protein